MIVVDTSVWIDNLRNADTLATAKLRWVVQRHTVVLADIVLLELLQGARDDRHALALESHFRRFRIVNVLDEHLAVRASRNYRLLRSKGFTIRKTPDLILATYCIEHGLPLLHDDRDFEPAAAHLGLMVY
ncbi:MAG: PIN domain nuclease [Shinella sp.]|nr:PIN domain nuclease [Shinella sp.]